METISLIDGNTYLRAAAAVLVISGSKFLDLEFNQQCKKFLAMPVMRKLIIFSYIYIITGKALLSLIVTLIFSMAVKVCFNPMPNKYPNKNVVE